MGYTHSKFPSLVFLTHSSEIFAFITSVQYSTESAVVRFTADLLTKSRRLFLVLMLFDLSLVFDILITFPSLKFLEIFPLAFPDTTHFWFSFYLCLLLFPLPVLSHFLPSEGNLSPWISSYFYLTFLLVILPSLMA